MYTCFIVQVYEGNSRAHKNAQTNTQSFNPHRNQNMTQLKLVTHKKEDERNQEIQISTTKYCPSLSFPKKTT